MDIVVIGIAVAFGVLLIILICFCQKKVEQKPLKDNVSVEVKTNKPVGEKEYAFDDEDFCDISHSAIPPIIYKKVKLFESGYYLTLRYTKDEEFIEYCFDRESLCEAHFAFDKAVAKALRSEMNLDNKLPLGKAINEYMKSGGSGNDIEYVLEKKLGVCGLFFCDHSDDFD